MTAADRTVRLKQGSTLRILLDGKRGQPRPRYREVTVQALPSGHLNITRVER